jgi:tRNA(adenine34) deaminase
MIVLERGWIGVNGPCPITVRHKARLDADKAASHKRGMSTPHAAPAQTPFLLPHPMRLALDLARTAADTGEVPVGAVITRDGAVVASASNRMRVATDPTAHAEIEVIRAAAAVLGSERLSECDLWVTLEPCAMCAGAIAHARIKRLYFAAPDPKGGAVDHGPRFFTQPTCHHRPEIYVGLGEAESSAMLKSFFADRRPSKPASD